jgi:general secretion pathway protein N
VARSKVTGPSAVFATFVFAYLICLLWIAPATVLDSAVARASGGMVRLADATGTLWAGTGRLEARDASRGKGVGTELSWRFAPRLLLRGRFGYEVRLAGAGKSLWVGLLPGGVEISGADFVLPASILGLLLPRVGLIGPLGELHVKADRLSVAGRDWVGEGVVSWRSAGSVLAPVMPLGDYQFRLEGVTAGWEGTLRTLKGPLHLTGNGASREGVPFKFNVTARVDPEMQSQLVPFLRLFAVEREPGNFELRLDPGSGPVGLPTQTAPSEREIGVALPDPEFQLNRDSTLHSILDRGHDHYIRANALTLDGDRRQRRQKPTATAVIGVPVERGSDHARVDARIRDFPVQGPPPVRRVEASLAVAVDEGPGQHRVVGRKGHLGTDPHVVAAELAARAEMLGVKARVYPDLSRPFLAPAVRAGGEREDPKTGEHRRFSARGYA